MVPMAAAPTPLTPAIRPPRLRSGDLVALVAPSGPPPASRLADGIAVLESWGLEVVVMPNVAAGHRDHAYLAASDVERADDFTAAWADPDVRAVICARGGYGSQRMIDLVDWATLRAADPKVFVGYSDATPLHLAVAAELGVVSLHGPMVSTADLLDHPAAQEHLRATLFEPGTVQVLGGAAAHAVVGGRATGVTIGGCVSVLATSTGTASVPPSASGGLLLLEDINEPAYRVDSYLTQLRRSGWLDGLGGVALGSWTDCEPAEPVVADVLGALGVPIVGELGFGHGPAPLTMPLGVLAELDADAGTLTLDEPALS